MLISIKQYYVSLYFIGVLVAGYLIVIIVLMPYKSILHNVGIIFNQVTVLILVIGLIYQSFNG